jgi:hypothetical protein
MPFYTLVEPPKIRHCPSILAAFFVRSPSMRPRDDHGYPIMIQEERTMNHARNMLLAVLALALGACSPSIYGTVQLVDMNLQPIPVVKESPQGTVVNMINTTTTLEKASQAVDVDVEGKYESAKDSVLPGMYKVEVTRIGYKTETQSLDVSKFGGNKIDFKIKKIPEGKRKSVEGMKSDEDKIVNPGEVNLQPPTM